MTNKITFDEVSDFDGSDGPMTRAVEADEEVTWTAQDGWVGTFVPGQPMIVTIEVDRDQHQFRMTLQADGGQLIGKLTLPWLPE